MPCKVYTYRYYKDFDDLGFPKNCYTRKAPSDSILKLSLRPEAPLAPTAKILHKGLKTGNIAYLFGFAIFRTGSFDYACMRLSNSDLQNAPSTIDLGYREAP